MPGIFHDKEYDRMQNSEDAWLELAIEPFRFLPNDLLGLLPDRIDITDTVVSRIQSEHPEDLIDRRRVIHADSIVMQQLNDLLLKNGAELGDLAERLKNYPMHILKSAISKTYHLDDGGGFQFDYSRQKVIGDTKLFLVKSKSNIDDMEAKQIIDEWVQINVGHFNSTHVKECNEVLDVLGCKHENARKTRSGRRKSTYIRRRLKEIFVEDEWKIRDDTVWISFVKNVMEYLSTSSHAGLTNMLRLKCMVHKGNPIYSVEFVK